jgi:hypothetical protein
MYHQYENRRVPISRKRMAAKKNGYRAAHRAAGVSKIGENG